MTLNDPLANALSTIINSDKVGKKEVMIKPTSIVIKRVLQLMQDNQYVGSFIEVEDTKGNYLALNLLGNLNNCSVIKPRHAVSKDDFEKFEKRFLPAKNFGILIVSTPQGIMTHTEAKEKKIGGKLLAYCY